MFRKESKRYFLGLISNKNISRVHNHVERFEKYSMVGVQQIDRVVEVVQETLKGRVCRYVGSKRREHEKKKGRKRKDGGASLHLPKIRKNPLIEIIAINTGCLNTCTYCKTKHARGDLGSYPPDEICRRVQHVTKAEVMTL